MLFNLVVSLYTSRVVLQVLGVTDLGIYQVVAGVAAMFLFTVGSLAGATSRFLAYELGKGDQEKLSRTFSATLSAHIIEAIFVLILCETIGLWLTKSKLVIPSGRMDAALLVYQCAVLMTILSIIQIPYNSSIIAHEKMSAFAYIGILDTFLKLAACYILYLTMSDRLIVYGLTLLFFSILIQTIYMVYCRINFRECRFKWTCDWEVLRPILGFSSWELLSCFSATAKVQGVNVLINIFFGVALNAACGFANTVYGAVSGFVNNFMTSIRPAITKAYSINNFDRVNELIVSSSKYVFSLMLILSVPFFFEADFILRLWLSNPPVWTSTFCRIQLATLLIAVSYFPIRFAISATGRNQGISIVDSVVLLAVLPITYICFRLGTYPSAPYVIMLIAEILKSNSYPFILNKNLFEFKPKLFYSEVIIPCLLMSFVVILFSFIIYQNFNSDGWMRFFTMLILPTLLTCTITFFYIVDRKTRRVAIHKIKTLLN